MQKFIEKMLINCLSVRLLLVGLLLGAHGLLATSSGLQETSRVRILALFSGAENELALDHRLGRQVLQLAANKARQQNSGQLDNVLELQVFSDSSESTLGCLKDDGEIPSKVAEKFYAPATGDNLACYNQQEGGKNGSSLECLSEHENLFQEYLSVEKRQISERKIDAIIASACDHLVDLIARMAGYWQVPIYTISSVSEQFANKQVYPTLTRLSPSIGQLSLFIIKLMEQFKWRHLAIVVDRREAENRLIYDSLERAIERARYTYPIERHSFKLIGSNSTSLAANGNYLNTHVMGNNNSQCSHEMSSIFLAIQRVARVVLLLFGNDHSQSIRRALLCAHELQMGNGEYTFLAVNLGLKSGRSSGEQVAKVAETNRTQSEASSSAYDKSTASRTIDWFVPNEEINNAKAKQMFESLMLFSVELPIGYEYEYFVEQALDLVAKQYPKTLFERPSVGPMAVALHDSLLLAVEAIKRSRGGTFERQAFEGQQVETSRNDPQQLSADASLQESPTIVGNNSQKFIAFWNTTSLAGLLMRNMRINENGDQELDYTLSDMEPELGTMRPVGVFTRNSGQIQMLPNSYIHWPARFNAESRQWLLAGEAPPDEPECGFTGQAERCVDRQNLYAFLLVFAILLLPLVLIGSLSLMRYKQIKYQMQLDDYWWKISWSELDFVQLRATSALGSSIHSQLSKINLEARSEGVHSSTTRHLDLGSRVGSNVSAVSSCAARLSRPQSAISKAASWSRPAAPALLSSSNKAHDKRRQAVPLIVVPDSIVSATTSDKLQSANNERRRSSEEHTIVSSSKSLLPAPGQPLSLLAESASNSFRIRSEFSTLIKVSSLAVYKKQLVIVKQLNANSIDVTRNLLIELRNIRELVHENAAKFVGLCVEPNHLAIVYEYCSRGSLKELLADETVAIDWNLKYSIIGDLVNGLNFIHSTLFHYHGRLKSTNLVLDSRFTVKLTDFGLKNLYNQLELIEDCDTDEHPDGETCLGDNQADQNQSNQIQDEPDSTRLSMELRRQSSSAQTIYNMDSVSIRAEKNAATKATLAPHSQEASGEPCRPSELRLKNRGSARYFWTAPEHLRARRPHLAGSKRGDVYALGVILFEIFTRREPYFYGTNAKPRWSAINREKRLQQRQTGDEQAAPTGGAASTLGNAQRKRSSRGSVGPAAEGSAVCVAGGGSHQSRLRQIRGAGGSSALPIEEESLQQQQQQQQQCDAEEEQMTTVASSRVGSHHQAGRLALSSTGCRRELSRDEPLDAAHILDQLLMGVQPEPIRPYLPKHLAQDMEAKLVDLMRSCWSEAPGDRPTVGQLRVRLSKITNGATAKNYLDNLLERLQSYSNQLEQMVDAKSADILSEKARTEELLYQLLPKFVADKLKRSEQIVPQVFDGVTIFFSDIVGFEKYASVMSPGELVDLLNNIYSSFESIISSFDVTKIEVILDQFLVASGISLATAESQQGPLQEGSKEPEVETKASEPASRQVERQSSLKQKFARLRSGGGGGGGQSSEEERRLMRKQHLKRQQTIELEQQEQLQSSESEERFRRSSAEQIARMALCIRDLVKSFHFRHTMTTASGANNDEETSKAIGAEAKSSNGFVAATFNIRIGIHSGKVCAGIVGLKRPKFCLIGDTVNVASRMHTNSKANRIQVSGAARELLRHIPAFKLEPRGRIDIKGKGLMETFWLESSY